MKDDSNVNHMRPNDLYPIIKSLLLVLSLLWRLKRWFQRIIPNEPIGYLIIVWWIYKHRLTNNISPKDDYQITKICLYGIIGLLCGRCISS